MGKKNKILLRDVPDEAQDLTGKTIIFTGGTDGMGKLALHKLAAMGAELVVLGRNAEKTDAVVSALVAEFGDGTARRVLCDLSSQASVRASADEILRSCPRIDVLVNCAGANFSERVMTEDGVERTWAVNHLGGLLLTLLLRQRLEASSPSRIIHLSSATEKYGHIHLDDIHLERNWAVLRSYAQAKLALNMCTRKLAGDLRGTGVTVNALNPGWIKTELAKGRDITGARKVFGRALTELFAEPIERGADRIVTLVASPRYAELSGEFVYEDHIRPPNPEALDDALVEQVWQMSLDHMGYKEAR